MKKSLIGHNLIFLFLILFFGNWLSAHELTSAESAFLEKNPVIKLGIGESWAPFIFPDENGDHRGFDVDMINRINQLTGANIELVPGPWNEIVKMAETGE